MHTYMYKYTHTHTLHIHIHTYIHMCTYVYIVRDPGFYARPKRFPRPGSKTVRKMISGVTKVLDQP